MFSKSLIISILLLFLTTHEVWAVEGKALMLMHYFTNDEEGGLIWESKPMLAPAGASSETKVTCLFKEFFEGGRVDYMPDDVKLLSASLEGGHLSINVSKEILKYGGSYNERCLKNQIIKTALCIPGVDEVTLLIDSQLQALPEGSWIVNETDWLELVGE